MQPLKMIIHGSFWDSQIYAGRLYLFGTQGDIVTLNWDQLIGEWDLDPPLKLAMQCAYCRSDYLYGNRWSLFFADGEVQHLIRDKFARLSNVELTVPKERFEQTRAGQQDTPFPFPHADSTVYDKKLFVASSDGIHSASCNKRTRYPISTHAHRRWDAPVLALSASYGSLALAAGDEGLFELPIDAHRDVDRIGRGGEPEQVARQNCVDCRWAFYSIYGSSHVAEGCLVSYIKEADAGSGQFDRKFERLIPEQQIFHHQGYSWGTQDKLCQAQGQSVRVVRYSPWKEGLDERFQDLGVIELAAWKGDVIAGGIALFGIIIECDNALVIVRSDGPPFTLPGEPVNWRTFPRSKHYENQLHVIYEDRMEILSFNHDYFVDQMTKRSGLRLFRKRDGH